MASTRRQFLNRVLTAGVAVIAAYVVYPILRYFTPPAVALGGANKVFVTTTDDMKLNSAKFFRFLDQPAVLVRLPNGNYKALSAKCTHMGCTVAFETKGDYFLCECHGSEFSINGKVLKGPAIEPLPVYNVSTSGDKIYVSVKKLVA
ncbi:MAG: ubiquinol-cytochrome c reductase iron-sulfur subunit [Bacteroidetes bacterium]|nr:ubiquinol-cytochrome c reductase iron-sulfur subunit [Bacteroidota bacterium]